MATGSVQISQGSGTPIRVVTNSGVDAGADQQVMTIADATGGLLGGTDRPVGLVPSTLVVTATAAAAAAVTATLPAAGAGLFHYITNVTIQRTTSAATTGANSGFLTGGTNHALIFQLPSDTQAIGFSQTVISYTSGTPLRSTAANTATTFTTPVVTATIYRVTVTYYTGI